MKNLYLSLGTLLLTTAVFAADAPRLPSSGDTLNILAKTENMIVAYDDTAGTVDHDDGTKDYLVMLAMKQEDGSAMWEAIGLRVDCSKHMSQALYGVYLDSSGKPVKEEPDTHEKTLKTPTEGSLLEFVVGKLCKVEDDTI